MAKRTKWTRVKPTISNIYTTYTAPGYPTIVDAGKDSYAKERYSLYLPKLDPRFQIQCFEHLGIAKAYAEYYVNKYGLTYECEYYEIVEESTI